MRQLSDSFENEKNKQINRPVELYEVYLDEETLYLAAYQKDINFAGQTYRGFPVERDSISTNVDTQVDEVNVSFGNVSKEMSSYLAHTEIQGKRLVIRKVFLDADGEVINLSIAGRAGFEQEVESKEGEGLKRYEDHVVIFDGTIDAPEVDQELLTVNVVSRLDTLDKELPRRNYGVRCQWRFGSEECGVDVPTAESEVSNISSSYKEIFLNDMPDNSDDYWKYGFITVNGQSRMIESSTPPMQDGGTGSVRVDYPFDPNNIEEGDTAKLKAGCDKTYDREHNDSVWGCSRWDNQQFYGGFLSIPEIRDPRS